MIPALVILFLAFAQNISFTIVSRARNRDNMRYHLIASVASNGIWFLTFRQLILGKMNWILFIPYTLGTVAGSLSGAKISMWIEKGLHATSDGHLHGGFKHGFSPPPPSNVASGSSQMSQLEKRQGGLR